jgi:catechol 2,3-dioxygenase
MRYIVDPKVGIGHVHLKVADLQWVLDFHSGVLEMTQQYGEGAIGMMDTAHSNVR